jgi:hypothetical protein
MLRLKIFLVAMSFMLIGGIALSPNETSAACCMCGQWVRGCTPPGSYYQGILCQGCARPDPGVFSVSTLIYDGPLGKTVVPAFASSFVTAIDFTREELLQMRGGKCMRRSTELRFLMNVVGSPLL